MQCWSEANKYTLYGMLFGLGFPISSILFLYLMNDLGTVNSPIDLIRHVRDHQLLYVIDTAPLFLGIVARYAGIRQDRLHQFAHSLEQQVFDKTESLHIALEEARKANALITHMADHDTLTGLINRRRFEDTLDGWIKYAVRYERKGALLFVDLDKFKFINDSYGHTPGDHYLTAGAEL